MPDTCDRSTPLTRIVDLSNELARSHPKARELVVQLFAAFMEHMKEFGDARLIETAPRDAAAPLLLYCPKLGGWQSGKWLEDEKRWTSTMSDTTLEPTHWMPPPPDPQEA